MKKLLVIMVCLGILGLAGSAGATILNFNELSGYDPLDIGYAGLTWSDNWYYFHGEVFPEHGAGNYNYVGTITFPTPVTFQGSWVTASDSSGLMVWWEGYKEGETIGGSHTYDSRDVDAYLLPGESGYINVNWAEVASVRLMAVYFTYGGAQIDDLKFNEVPLPAAVWLLGSGLLGLAGLRRFRKS